MLAMMLVVMVALLGGLSYMIDGDLNATHKAAEAETVAQLLGVEYQAALSLCSQTSGLGCFADGMDINVDSMISPAIASGALYQSGIVVTHYDLRSGRIIAYVDESKVASTRLTASGLWGQVSAALITSSGMASGVGYWSVSTSTVMDYNNTNSAVISQVLGDGYKLQDGNPIIVQPIAPTGP